MHIYFFRCPFPICLQSYDSRLKYDFLYLFFGTKQFIYFRFRNHLLRQHKQMSEQEIGVLLDEGDKEFIRLKQAHGFENDGYFLSTFKFRNSGLILVLTALLLLMSLVAIMAL